MAEANPDTESMKRKIFEMTNTALVIHSTLTEWITAVEMKTPKSVEETLAMYQNLTTKLRAIAPHMKAVGEKARTHLIAIARTSSIMSQMRQLIRATRNTTVSDAFREQSSEILTNTMVEFIPEHLLKDIMESLMVNLSQVGGDYYKFVAALSQNERLANRRETRKFLEELEQFLYLLNVHFMAGVVPNA